MKLLTDAQLRAAIKKTVAAGAKTTLGCGMGVLADIRPSGRATFRLRKNGRSVTLGSYPELTLNDARRRALDTDLDTSRSPLFETATTEWLDFIAARTKNGKRCINLRTHLRKLAFLRGVRLAEIKPRTVRDRIQNNDDSAHNRYLTVRVLCQMLDWAVDNALIETNQCAVLRRAFPLPRERPGTRGVMPDELRPRVWDKLTGCDRLRRTFFLLLALSALRLSPALRLRWDWIEDDEIRIPGVEMKTGKPFTLPVTDELKRLLDGWHVWRRENDWPEDEWVFSRLPGRGPVPANYMREPLKAACADESGTCYQHIHGFRKVCKTWCDSAGIVNDVSEAMLSHERSGLEAVYSRYDFGAEVRQGFAKYDAWVASTLPLVFGVLLEGQP